MGQRARGDRPESGARGSPAASAGGDGSQARSLARHYDSLVGDVLLRHAPGRRVLDLGGGSPQIAAWVALRASELRVVHPDDLLASRDVAGSLALSQGAYDTVYSIRTVGYEGPSGDGREDVLGALLELIAWCMAPDGVAFIELANATSLRRAARGLAGPGLDPRPDETLQGDAPRSGQTRYETLRTFLRKLPASLWVTDVRGIGIVTATEAQARRPVIGAASRLLDWRMRDHPMLRYFGAELLIALRHAPMPHVR